MKIGEQGQFESTQRWRRARALRKYLQHDIHSIAIRSAVVSLCEKDLRDLGIEASQLGEGEAPSMLPTPEKRAAQALRLVCKRPAVAHNIPAIVTAMMAHPKAAPIQENGCAALKVLATDDNRAAIGSVGGTSAVIDGMAAQRANGAVQEQGCGALWNLACGSKVNRVAIGQQGGIEGIVAAMRQHTASAAVQRTACGALATLVFQSAANRAALLHVFSAVHVSALSC